MSPRKPLIPGLTPVGHYEPRLRLVSVSRVSPSRDKDREKAHRREHQQNTWTAKRHKFTVVSEVSFLESALSTNRGEEIIGKADIEDAAGIVIPTLRRLGVGEAQVALRKMIEANGFLILSGRDSEDALLRGEPGHLREAGLFQIAATDYCEWAVNLQRRAGPPGKRISPFWTSPEGQAVLGFVRDRDHLTLDRLGQFLTAQGFLTPSGKDHWYPQTVKRAREVDAVLFHAGLPDVTAVDAG